MIGQNLKDNQGKKPNSREMEKLKNDFPQFFSKDGEFRLDRFKDFLQEEDIDIEKEGYELKFLGKSYANYIGSLETETYISPDSEHNAKKENKDSENLYIAGDNIDALKHLLGSYAGKIKCIYIDPPYNTGSDGFVYPDNFQFNKEDLSEKIGIMEEEAGRILELAGKSNHSAWLTFMYPRLALARDLLSDDGVIFISIDDNEQTNLKLICDEIFGEENFIAQLVWERAFSPKNDAKFISNSHDYVCMFAKSINKFQIGRLPRTEKANARYSNPDNDPRGVWQSADLSVKTYNKSCDYPIKTPSGRIVEPPAGRCWRLSEKVFSERLQDNRIWFGSDGNGVPRIKRFLSELKFNGMAPTSLLFHKEVGHSQEGTREVVELFDGQGVFDGPKPSRLLQRILTLANLNKDSIVLDFFSGSATTAHAVMQLNAEDGGHRKYIMVQLPEKIEEDKPAYKAGYRSIDAIGRARIKKAAQKIKEETGADIDYGYKLFYLENPDKTTLMDLENFEPENKLITDDMVSVFDNTHSKGKESILATWLAEDGYGLSRSSKPYPLEGYMADRIEKTLYIIDEGLQQDDAMTLIKRIENEELDITRLVIYAHSVPFHILHELRKNLKVLRNNKNVTMIERF